MYLIGFAKACLGTVALAFLVANSAQECDDLPEVRAIREYGGMVYFDSDADRSVRVMLGSLWTGGDGGLSLVAQLGNVVSLDLWNCPVTDDGLANVSKLHSLRSLSLRDTLITDAGLCQLAGLTKLVQLDLSHTAVSDQGLSCLKPLRDLRELGVDKTVLTDNGIAAIDLPNLQTVCRLCEERSESGEPVWFWFPMPRRMSGNPAIVELSESDAAKFLAKKFPYAFASPGHSNADSSGSRARAKLYERPWPAIRALSPTHLIIEVVRREPGTAKPNSKQEPAKTCLERFRVRRTPDIDSAFGAVALEAKLSYRFAGIGHGSSCGPGLPPGINLGDDDVSQALGPPGYVNPSPTGNDILYFPEHQLVVHCVRGRVLYIEHEVPGWLQERMKLKSDAP